MWNAGPDEAQAGIKVARRNINNFRYADDTTLMAENEEELKSLLMTVKEEGEKVDLKLNIKKNVQFFLDWMEVYDLGKKPARNNKEENLMFCIRRCWFSFQTLLVTRRESLWKKDTGSLTNGVHFWAY